MATPQKDAQFAPFTTNMKNRLGTSAAVYHVGPDQVAAYDGLHSAYIARLDALTAAREQGTRSASLTAAKDAAKDALMAATRNIYASVASAPDVSAADKILLGVHVRQGGGPVPVPSTRPAVEVAFVEGRTVAVRLHDAGGGRAKVAGAVGAYVYAFVGAAYPTDPSKWEFVGQATRSTYRVAFDPAVPDFAQVWVCAAWVTRRGETGPTSVPVTTHVGGGVVMRRAA